MAQVNNKATMDNLAGDKPASDGMRSNQINASKDSTAVIKKYHGQYFELADSFTFC